MNDKTYHARIMQKLTAAFAPTLLEINDNSASHKGHAGYNPLGETHFTIKIISTKFENMSLVARHREVYGVLADELRERVHALSLQCMTKAEYTNR